MGLFLAWQHVVVITWCCMWGLDWDGGINWIREEVMIVSLKKNSNSKSEWERERDSKRDNFTKVPNKMLLFSLLINSNFLTSSSIHSFLTLSLSLFISFALLFLLYLSLSLYPSPVVINDWAQRHTNEQYDNSKII